jgi:hypothetical protein
MKNRNRSYQDRTARTARFAWVAAATLIAALILGSVAGVPIAAANSDGVARGLDAAAARYQAQGAYYSALADADTARWVALGAFYAQSSTDTPYTDVSRFYVERMRAQARMQAQAGQGGDLALSPELAFARRSYRSTGGELAVNPELRLARAGYRAGVGLLACSRSDADLSANPELSAFGRNRHC